MMENKLIFILLFTLIYQVASLTNNVNDSTSVKLNYILHWSSPLYVQSRQYVLKHCYYTNCYFTSNRKLLADITEFDAIVFSIDRLKKKDLPRQRSPHQKYVMASIESSANYPFRSNDLDGYFNWTWTYRLDSDILKGYMYITDSKGNIIGPNKTMHWMKRENMLPVSEDLKKILSGKTKAAAWFVSNCLRYMLHLENRMAYGVRLVQILQSKYNLSVDVYGGCGRHVCPRSKEQMCYEKIKRDYYFYLSFENTFSEDYVTEKLLTAVQNSAVPIVYGGANYSRFLPEGSYLNARRQCPEELAAKMYELINNFDKYVEFFRWTNHYSYYKDGAGSYCRMCAAMNDRQKVEEKSVHREITEWWNPPKSDEATSRIKICKSISSVTISPNGI